MVTAIRTMPNSGDAHTRCVSASRDCTVRCWNVERGTCAVGGAWRRGLRSGWLAGEETHCYAHNAPVSCVAASSSGIVVFCSDRNVHLWTLSNGRVKRMFYGCEINSVCVTSGTCAHGCLQLSRSRGIGTCADNAHVIAGGEDGSVIVWDMVKVSDA